MISMFKKSWTKKMVDDQTFLGDRFFLYIFIFIKLKHIADETSGFPRNIGFCQDHHIHTMVHVNLSELLRFLWIKKQV